MYTPTSFSTTVARFLLLCWSIVFRNISAHPHASCFNFHNLILCVTCLALETYKLTCSLKLFPSFFRYLCRATVAPVTSSWRTKGNRQMAMSRHLPALLLVVSARCVCVWGTPALGQPSSKLSPSPTCRPEKLWSHPSSASPHHSSYWRKGHKRWDD